jgi:glycosyltransferase involved in cell wall biosynthesis
LGAGGPRARVVLLGRQPLPSQFSIERVVDGLRAHLPDRFDVEVVIASHPSKGVRHRLAAMWDARRHQGDITHVTGDINYASLLLDGRRTVLTVHDTELRDRLTGLDRALFTWLWLRLPVRHATIVTVPSEATLRDLVRVTRVDPAKVRVIPNTIGEEFTPAPRPFAAARPTVLLIGTAPNKNVERAAAALAGVPCRAVVVGRLDDGQRKALADAGVDYVNRVDLDDAAVVRCYRECDVLLYVSTKEGFGLPVLEAQATGRPVVTSDREPLTTVAGGAACLVDCDDVAAIRAGLQRVLDDAAYRDELVAAGFRNVGRFQIDRIAAQYAAAYDEVLSRTGARTPR